MGLVTVIFLVIAAFFCWRGYQKGFVKSISRLMSWAIAYPAAIFFTKPLAKWVVHYTPLDGLVAYFVAGSSIFLVVSLLVELLLKAAARAIPQSDAVATSSKVGGASIGLVMGTLLGLLVVYAIGVTKKPDIQPVQNSVANNSEIDRDATTRDLGAPVPQIKDLARARDSFIEASAKKLISTAAASAADIAFDDPAATQVTRAFMEDPQTMLSHVQQAANNGKMKLLLENEDVQSLLTTGDVNALMRNQEFQNVMNDPDIQALLATADTAESGSRGQQAAAEKMVAAWRRVDTLKHDPRIIAIVQDPEFQAQLNSPNKMQLMMNPKLNQLTEIIFSSETLAANGMSRYQIQDLDQSGRDANYMPIDTTPDTAPADNNPDDHAPVPIYRWTDAQGKVHYSDKPKSSPH